jgi:4'-phosphopantetheinyl transferase
MPPSVVLVDGRSGDHSGFIELLDTAELERHRRMRAPDRRRDFVLGRAVAKICVAQIERTDLASITIATDADGKPFLEGSGLKLSISHSHGWIAVALGPDPLGIDVQTLVDELPSRVLGPDETAWVESLAGSERRAALTSLWTIKEARGKLAGTGLRFPVPEVPVPLKERDEDGTVKWQLFGTDEVKGAVATGAAGVLPSTVETLSVSDLRRRLERLGS